MPGFANRGTKHQQLLSTYDDRAAQSIYLSLIYVHIEKGRPAGVAEHFAAYRTFAARTMRTTNISGTTAHNHHWFCCTQT